MEVPGDVGQDGGAGSAAVVQRDVAIGAHRHHHEVRPGLPGGAETPVTLQDAVRPNSVKRSGRI